MLPDPIFVGIVDLLAISAMAVRLLVQTRNFRGTAELPSRPMLRKPVLSEIVREGESWLTWQQKMSKSIISKGWTYHRLFLLLILDYNKSYQQKVGVACRKFFHSKLIRFKRYKMFTVPSQPLWRGAAIGRLLCWMYILGVYHKIQSLLAITSVCSSNYQAWPSVLDKHQQRCSPGVPLDFEAPIKKQSYVRMWLVWKSLRREAEREEDGKNSRVKNAPS